MAYIRLDKISANAHIESIVSTGDLVNGQFVALGVLQLDGEAFLATPSGDQEESLVLHVTVPLTYEDRTTELDFVLKAGKEGRGLVLVEGDVYSTTLEGITGEAVVGAKVNPSALGLTVVDGLEAGALHGKVIAIENDFVAGQLAVIRITK
jgi:hypothetical protein